MNSPLIEQLNRVIEMEDNAALSKDIEIEFIHPKKEFIIEADESRMEQVWINLLSNAIKYTNEHGVVTVEVRRTATELQVRFEDTGVGMSQMLFLISLKDSIDRINHVQLKEMDLVYL